MRVFDAAALSAALLSSCSTIVDESSDVASIISDPHPASRSAAADAIGSVTPAT
jgi:hypothetical protein